MRRTLALLATLLLGRSALLPVEPDRAQDIVIRATPVALDPAHPARRRVGALVFERGWRLASDSPLFGGLSGLALADGSVLAISDSGRLTSFAPDAAPNWFARTEPLPRFCGPAPGLGVDLEGVALANGSLWLSSEWRNAICRLGRQPAEGVARSEMTGWSRNFGGETLIRLRDGRFVAVEEGAPYALLVFDRDPVDPAARVRRLTYRPPPGYRPTDGAQLSDGRIVILNRRLSFLRGFSAKLVLFDALPSPGRPRVVARELATLAGPLVHDNFEGLAAAREHGRTVLWLVSDDNFLLFQQTLLLKFRLDDASAS